MNININIHISTLVKIANDCISRSNRMGQKVKCKEWGSEKGCKTCSFYLINLFVM